MPEEKQEQPLIDLLADLFPLWGELSSDSQELLPMWVRRECAEAFRRDNPRYMLPAICKDSKKGTGGGGGSRVAPAPASDHRPPAAAPAAPPASAAAGGSPRRAAPAPSPAADARPQPSPRNATSGGASGAAGAGVGDLRAQAGISPRSAQNSSSLPA